MSDFYKRQRHHGLRSVGPLRADKQARRTEAGEKPGGLTSETVTQGTEQRVAKGRTLLRSSAHKWIGVMFTAHRCLTNAEKRRASHSSYRQSARTRDSHKGKGVGRRRAHVFRRHGRTATAEQGVDSTRPLQATPRDLKRLQPPPRSPGVRRRPQPPPDLNILQKISRQ